MSASTQPKIELADLHVRHYGLTPALSTTFYEAASVCLSRHHTSPVNLSILRDSKETIRIAEFTQPDARTLGAWANEIDTTEAGAYAVSLATIEAEERLVAVKRAETLTGADWYVSPVGTPKDDLESCFRLEVSGIDKGDRAAVASRLKQKVEQTKRGASNLPALASVVGFRDRAVAIQKVN